MLAKEACGNSDEISKALTSGRFIGCADVSGSMTWSGTYPIGQLILPQD